MQNRLSTVAGFATAALAVSVIGIGAANADKVVTDKGQQISSGATIINGQAYITISEAAKLVGGTVHHSGGEYIIATSGSGSSSGVPPGGANQIEGHKGSVGQWLFTGKWKFEVVSYTTTQSYQTVYSSDTSTYTPNGNNDKLVIVNCILKNAKTKEAEPMLRTQNAYNTAVTDDQGGSYAPLGYDFPGGSGYGPNMLPGSTTHFAIVLDVPKSSNVQDFIFTLFDMDDPTDQSDYRIHLNP